MLKRFAVFFLILCPALYGQVDNTTDFVDIPDSNTEISTPGSVTEPVTPVVSSELTTGKSATLGVEATTKFAMDIDNKTTGLETKAGIELIFPLFPKSDMGVNSNNFDQPAVRLALKNAAFTWWNTYETKGGNYEQDDFNRWGAGRPLILSFDSFYADAVWKNYFFRVASSTTVMQNDITSLFSIFDDVMDANDRWYYRRAITRALWHTERYNIQDLPLLKDKIVRNYTDDDYRGAISGMLAVGAEFDKFTAAVKAASNKNGIENTDNAWLFGADIEVVPIDNFKIALTGLIGKDYEKTTVGKNPLDFGASVEYRIPLSDSDRYFLTPKAGFDFIRDTETGDSEWELGAGILLHTRGFDYTTSSRILDWDDIIPVGFSASMNMNHDSGINAMVSWFDPAGPDSMLPNFGGFLQLELGNILEANDEKSALGILAQLEYMIAGKFTPYIRGGYTPEFQNNSTTAITGDYLIKAAIGCFMTPIHFFSVDLRYEMDTKLLDSGGTENLGNMLNLVFTIRM
ncbi:MAG: hypothetical protein LBI04_06290 [Treponema sp.]|jgi:hypothetical protein|nr:hypothetical protein [Treponema sp.]